MGRAGLGRAVRGMEEHATEAVTAVAANKQQQPVGRIVLNVVKTPGARMSAPRLFVLNTHDMYHVA